MATTILLTGFGPFPGAPRNPTEPLVEALARVRHPAFASVRRVAHVFRVSYQTVDRELPELIARERPDALIMFGLATRATGLRIETRGRNTITRRVADVGGVLPASTMIAPDGPDELPLRAPAQRLVMAARKTGVPVVLSRDAGGYLCNYACWRAAEIERGTAAGDVRARAAGARHAAAGAIRVRRWASTTWCGRARRSCARRSRSCAGRVDGTRR